MSSPGLKDAVLVTGGAGFIGSELVAQLAADGHRVVVLDNLTNGRPENLKGLPPEQVRLVIGDVRQTADVRPLMAGVRMVFHLACLGVRHSIHAPAENHEVNAGGTLQLLIEARAAGVERFVQVSSSEIYGAATKVPISEGDAPWPMTVYGASKLAGECYARAFHRTYGYPTVIVRPFNAYGPRSHHEGDSGEVIPKFLFRTLAGRPMVIFGDGTQTRDFTYVSDVARGIRLAGFAEAAVGETINIGSGREISINELAETVAASLGMSAAPVQHTEGRPGDVLRLRADTSKARALLAFEPTVPLGEGLGRLQTWYSSLNTTPDLLLQQEIVRNWISAEPMQ